MHGHFQGMTQVLFCMDIIYLKNSFFSFLRYIEILNEYSDYTKKTPGNGRSVQSALVWAKDTKVSTAGLKCHSLLVILYNPFKESIHSTVKTQIDSADV